MRSALLALTLAVAVAAHVDTPAQKTFAALKRLEGTWTMGSGDKTAKVIYRLTGAGTTLIETQLPGTSMEMVTAYHLDGPNKLMLTHYCAAGNQPTMALVPGGTDADFKFDFVSGTNMKPSDMHIHSVHYRIIDKDHIVTEWGGYMKGKPAGAETFDLHRDASTAASR